jgi:carboxylesterase type B
MAYILFFITGLVICAIFSTLSTTGSKNPIAIDHEKNITYHGFSSSKGIDSFLNIPFGQNTGGAGRFAPPKSFILSHSGVVNATIPGTVCPESSGSTGGVNTNVTPNDISEGCLNLRISRPAGTKSTSKLPVMAFIYGGQLVSFGKDEY